MMSPFGCKLVLASVIALVGLYFSLSLLPKDLLAASRPTFGSLQSHKDVESSSAADASGGKPAVTTTTAKRPTPPTAEGEESLAYMTFFSGTVANTSETNYNNDPYFVATRLLGWQLMHCPETRSTRNISFVVLVSADVPAYKRERLAKDGAVVLEVDYVDTPDWVQGEMPEWADLMTKLRAWELVQFSRALFLDGDMILNGPLDGVFDDPAAQHFVPSVPPNRHSHASSNATSAETEDEDGDDESLVPDYYLLATTPEANPIHAYPPTAANGDFKDPAYFNAGFFLFGPSLSVFDYYTSLLQTPNSFDPRYVEQNLLNHAHRPDGPMPWQPIDTQWNIRFPSVTDRDASVVSMHDKWWRPQIDAGLQGYYSSLRWRMEGFYEVRDLWLVDQSKGSGGWW